MLITYFRRLNFIRQKMPSKRSKSKERERKRKARLAMTEEQKAIANEKARLGMKK